MERFTGASLHLKNYKCFYDEPQGFDEIKPINIIIGRNNSGKSSLIEMLEHANEYKTNLEGLGHPGKPPSLIVTKRLSEDEVKRVFAENISGGGIPGGNHWNYGKQFVGGTIRYEQHVKKRDFLSMDPPLMLDSQTRPEYQQKLVNVATSPFQGVLFNRLNAERNIQPEDEADVNRLTSDGTGFTNLVRRFLNMDTLPSALVEKTLLKEINAIVRPDMDFSDIVVQQNQSSKKWEIYLEETTKGRIPVSHSGSGIKTILLALGFLYLVPHIENKTLGDYLFCFEELENNLHPALQRRLLLYLRNIAEQNHCVFMLTTHSSVFIDLFNADPLAQIIHVTHDGERAVARSPKTYIERKGILDDLDIRASDLLLANCIIWVEGPSDRIYINRWIELFTDGRLKEGAHYQCVFYGGRLLAHLSANPCSAAAPEDAVSILKVNRNAIVVIDSDRTRNRTEVNETKKRLATEVRSVGGLAWITDGKEIENYISVAALEKMLSCSGLTQPEKWIEFSEYLDGIKAGEGQRFMRNKVLFAERITEPFSREDLKGIFDLEERITEVVSKVRAWNCLHSP